MITQGHTPEGIILVDVPDPELDRIQEILATSPPIITMPEMWELVRLISHRLGYWQPV